MNNEMPIVEQIVMKVAIWTETEWAFGRIADAISKHTSPTAKVTIYDWKVSEDNNRFFHNKEWLQYDIVISNSALFEFYERFCGEEIPTLLRRRLAIIAHCPIFDSSHFSEFIYKLTDVHYAGVSQETCTNLKAKLEMDEVEWTPFGADIDLFAPLNRQPGKIQRIGFVGRPPSAGIKEEYYKTKGHAVFETICAAVEAEPVYLHDRKQPSELFADVDLLLCCSELEGGPLGIFEAAASGVPVLSTAVGNAQHIEGIALYSSTEQAIERIRSWNAEQAELNRYAKDLMEEVRSHWSMSFLIRKHLLPWLVDIYIHNNQQLKNDGEEAKEENVPIRLHMPAIPHTITLSEFSHCAFTGKVLRFAPMMRSVGFEVYHYGVETSESGATKQVDIMTKAEWEKLRIASYKSLHPELTIAECKQHFEDHSNFIGDLANWSTPLYEEFSRRFRLYLQLHYRSKATDIVCLPFGKAHDRALNGLDVVQVETGIGYPDSFRDFRIFESYAWLHHQLGIEKKQCQNYWFVVPNYFDTVEWPLQLHPEPKTIGFFGRICHIKGCNVFVEIAKRFPEAKFIMCGQGNPEAYATQSNIVYKPPISGRERGTYLGSLCALIAPSCFVEPFCGVAVEAQLCGTPVMAPECGAQTETIEQAKTGLLCHTLADYCLGVRMALEGKFDRDYISRRAVAKYDMFNVAKQYDYVFNSIIDIHNGLNGWYAPDSHLENCIAFD